MNLPLPISSHKGWGQENLSCPISGEMIGTSSSSISRRRQVFFKTLNHPFSFPFHPVLELEAEQTEHRHNDQGKEGGKGQTIDHGPCQGTPEGGIISSQVDIGVKMG